MGNTVQINLASDGGASVVTDIGKLERKVEELAKSAVQMGKETAKSAKVAAGSYQALEKELKDNVRELKKMEVGTAAFTAQKAKVDRLSKSFAKTKSDIAGNSREMGAFDKVTASVGSQMLALAGGIGVVTGAVRALVDAVEQVEKGNENKRLATIDFETGLVEGKQNFPQQEDKKRLRGEALKLAADEGLNAGGVAASLGNLKSRGASDLDEATEFLREAARLKPGDIAAAEALASAGLVEARGTGNRDAAQVIGGILSAQVASQTSNPLEFGKAFSANTVSLVQSGGFTEEQAREQAAKFSIVEPKSADIAATSQKAYERAVRKFDKLDGRGTTFEKMKILEQDEALRDEFIAGLPDEGRNAIIRIVNPNAEDRATFAQVERDIVSGGAAAQQLKAQQADVARDAPNLIANAKREAQGKVNEITSSDEAKFDANVKSSVEAVRARAADDDVASYLGDKFGNSFGGLVESATQGFTNTRISQLGNIAATDAQPEDRQFAQEQLVELRKIAEASDLKEQATLLKGILDAIDRNNQLLIQREGEPVKVKVEGNGPKQFQPAAAEVQ